MDHQLKERLDACHEAAQALCQAESQLLEFEAHEKILYSKLYLCTEGTVGERQAKVYVSQDWVVFTQGLSAATSRAHNAKRLYELSLKAYDGTYLTYKIERGILNREP